MRAPLRPAAAARDLGATAVLAPSLDGPPPTCAGLLALLADAGVPTRFVVLCDGTDEAACAASLDALGLDAEAVTSLRLPPDGLPEAGTPAFDRAAAALAAALDRVETVVVPCRADCDEAQAATWALARAAAPRLDDPPRWIEYAARDTPPADAGPAWRLDVRPVAQRKRRALAAVRARTDSRAADASWELFVEGPRPWLYREPQR